MTRRVRTLVLLVLLAAVSLPAQAQQTEPAGTVRVTFTVSRMRRIASDQMAVWIEDEKGGFVRTLFVTSFAGRRAGWKIRPQVTPTWALSSGVKDTPQAQIDAVSAATPPNGPVTVVWDLKDRAGIPVAAGVYRYRLEANISWENTVLWTGTIRVGGARDSSRATAVYSPAGAEKLGVVVSEVAAEFAPPGKP